MASQQALLPRGEVRKYRVDPRGELAPRLDQLVDLRAGLVGQKDLARVRVQGDQERVALVVEHVQQGVPVQRRRRALPEGIAHAQLDAEVLLPEQLPVQVEAVDPERAEGRDQALAVGDGALGFWKALREVFPELRPASGAREKWTDSEIVIERRS